MEYKAKTCYSLKCEFWFSPTSGEIADYYEFVRLRGRRKKEMLKAGSFSLFEELIVAKCPTHGVWHPVDASGALFYKEAIEKVKDCEEFKRVRRLYRLSRSLARLYIEGYDKQEALKVVNRWAKNHLTSEKFHQLPFIAEMFPCARDEILRLYEELEPKRLAKLLKE